MIFAKQGRDALGLQYAEMRFIEHDILRWTNQPGKQLRLPLIDQCFITEQKGIAGHDDRAGTQFAFDQDWIGAAGINGLPLTGEIREEDTAMPFQVLGQRESDLSFHGGGFNLVGTRCKLAEAD